MRFKRSIPGTVGIFLCVFYAVGTASDSKTTNDCRRIAGEWEMVYSGRSCEGEAEKGKLVLNIDADCSFTLQKENTLPFISALFLPGGKLRFTDNRITAQVDVPFEECGGINLQATIHEERRDRIMGTYTYAADGGGRFKGGRTKHSP